MGIQWSIVENFVFSTLGVDESNMMFLYLPPEILLIILGLVDPRDILNLRQTCRTLQKLTYDHSVWVSKLNEHKPYLPIPLDILHHREKDQNFPANTIESAVVKGQRTFEAWPRARKRTPTKLKPPASDRVTMIGLKLVVERWLVAVYYDGIATIYDTNQGSPVLRGSLVLEENGWTSFSVGINPGGERMILALSTHRPPYKINIYQIELLDVNLPFTLIRSISLPHLKVIQALDITNRLVIVSTLESVTVLKWDEEYDHEALCRRGAIFNMKVEDTHGLWDAVVGVGLLGSHVLVHKNRSLHVCRYKNQRADEPPRHVLKHKFMQSFEDVSFSEYSSLTNKFSKTTTHEISTFAYDYHGVFQYTIRLSVPEAPGLLPLLDVQLISVYPLVTDYSSRGRLSTLCIGPQGKFGIWVEHKWMSEARYIHIWCREAPQSSVGGASAERVLFAQTGVVMEIERRVVYTLPSVALRDDTALSALSELDGTIYLGHRSGSISVVPLEH